MKNTLVLVILAMAMVAFSCIAKLNTSMKNETKVSSQMAIKEQIIIPPVLRTLRGNPLPKNLCSPSDWKNWFVSVNSKNSELAELGIGLQYLPIYTSDDNGQRATYEVSHIVAIPRQGTVLERVTIYMEYLEALHHDENSIEIIEYNPKLHSLIFDWSMANEKKRSYWGTHYGGATHGKMQGICDAMNLLQPGMNIGPWLLQVKPIPGNCPDHASEFFINSNGDSFWVRRDAEWYED